MQDPYSVIEDVAAVAGELLGSGSVLGQLSTADLLELWANI